MKRIVLIILCGILFGGCSLAPKKAGIEIMSNPPAKVYLDGKEAGSTPYKNTSLKPGDINVKLVVSTGKLEWERKITLVNYTNTVIDWDFGDDEAQSGGYVLYMEKTGEKDKASILVNASPDKCAVGVDNEIKGFTPANIKEIKEGDRQVTISFPGYKSLNLFVKGINNYQLIVDAKLAIEKPSIVPPTQPPSQGQIAKKTMAKIKNTETGWLRVRAEANSNSSEVTKVKPGETYPIVEEQGEWMKIDLGGGKQGWINGRYAEKVEE